MTPTNKCSTPREWPTMVTLVALWAEMAVRTAARIVAAVLSKILKNGILILHCGCVLSLFIAKSTMGFNGGADSGE